MRFNIMFRSDTEADIFTGINNLLKNYIELNNDDDFVIAFTSRTKFAAALTATVLSSYKSPYKFVFMHPLIDSDFEERLNHAIPHERDTSGRCILIVYEWDTMSHSDIIKSKFDAYNEHQFLVIRAINSDETLFSTGLAINPDTLTAYNATLLSKFMVQNELRITTESGTNLIAKLNSNKYRWISNRGVKTGRKFIVIPSGEIATHPASLSGTLVADFAINVNRSYDDDVRLDRVPVTLTIENSNLTSYQCDDQRIMSFLDECFSKVNAKLVGELGFGTHRAVTEPTPNNSHLNERCPGVHIGFGQHNQSKLVVPYDCDIHIDLISKNAKVSWLDNNVHEEINLSTFEAIDINHPENTSPIDLFSESAVIDYDC